MSATRKLIQPIIAARNRVFLLERSYQRISDQVGNQVDRLTLPAYAAGFCTVLAAIAAGLSGVLSSRAAVAAVVVGLVLATVPLQLGAVYLLVRVTYAVRLRAAVLSARQIHSLHQVTPAAASAAWNTPTPYRPRRRGGRLRHPGSPEEVAAKRAADVLRQQLEGRGVDADTAGLLSGLNGGDDMSLGELLDTVAELDEKQRTQALQLACSASRTMRYLQDHGGEDYSAVPRAILAAYVQARPDREQQETIARLWPQWGGSVESLLATVRAL
jgi:hypothetical protein